MTGDNVAQVILTGFCCGVAGVVLGYLLLTLFIVRSWWDNWL